MIATRGMLWEAAAVLALLVSGIGRTAGAEAWPQFKLDSRRSGDAADRSIRLPLQLAAARPLSDAVLTSPAVAEGRVYVVDGSGVAYCLDARTLDVVWTFASRGGPANCNNMSSPAVLGPYVHFGTMAGSYYVLDRATGRLVRELACDGPIFGSPAASGGRAYFATLGAEVYAVTPDGRVCWKWDFVKELLGFEGDRWSGEAWRRFKGGRVTWRDHFCCSRNLAVHDGTVVVPAGGRVVFLRDEGDAPRVAAVGEIPPYAGSEFAAAFGLSLGPEGEAYLQWHRRDNAGRVEIFRLRDGKLETSFVPGTQTAINLPGLLSFCSVSMRGTDVFRCRPEEGFGLCRHRLDGGGVERLPVFPSIASPVLTREHVLAGALDGRLYVAPLAGGDVWSFATPFGAPITAPPAVADGRVYVACEDGYVYALAPEGNAAPPDRPLGLERIRTPLPPDRADPKLDWYTNYGDMANTNANDQGLEPPLKIQWIRRVQGTVKHIPVCGGGRMYTHTAEGQIYAVEQETGRLLWRRYWPGVYLSFTAPLYYEGKLLLPQAGMTRSRLRCLDAATGRLLWEAPFTGSPSWSRQGPPVVADGVVVYASGSGRYAPQGTDKAFVMKGDPAPSPDGAEIMSWIYTHNNPYYPKDNRPLIWAWDLETGKLLWSKDFSEYGRGGNDCGLCLMDGVVYYSTFFGYSPSQRKRRGLPPGPNGLTAALDPATGQVRWLTTDYYVTAGCTISGKDGRLYLGGYNQPDERTEDRYVFCLDAKDGSLVWRSDPVRSAVNVITVGDQFVFTNASGHDGHVLDKRTGRIVARFNHKYACTRFTVSGHYALGANMDLIDLARAGEVVSTGPCIDSRECLGGAVSNGRLFYTSQASGVQACLAGGEDAQRIRSPWER